MTIAVNRSVAVRSRTVGVDTSSVLQGRLGLTSLSIHVRRTEATVGLAVGGIVVDDGLLQCLVHVSIAVLLLDRLLVDGVASVGSVNERLETETLAWVLFDHSFVLAEDLCQLFVLNVVHECARAQWVGHGQSELAITRLENGLGGLLKDLLVEVLVVDGQTDTREEVEQSAVLLVAEQATVVGQGGGVCHVNGDGVAVAKRNLWDQFVEWRPGVAVCDNAVETDLVQVGGLELQHLEDTSAVDLVRSLTNLWLGIVCAAESRVDQVLTIFIEEVEGGQMSTARNLDQLSETVSGLGDWKRPEEAEVEESVHRCVVCTQTVLVVAIVDGDLDRDRGVDQSNDSGWDTDVVGVSSVRSTSIT